MAYLSAFVAFLTALPDLLKLFTSIKNLGVPDPAKFIQDAGNLADQINSAKSDKEKQDAAQALHNLIAGI